MRDTIIEHLHPFFGKGTMDDSYRDSNSPEMYAHDRKVFADWLADYATDDIAKVRNALA
jgi:flavin-dependent dehydrogenase